MNFEAWIDKIANGMSVEAFSLVGGLIEEIIAPIPSPLVMMTAGTLAEAQNSGNLHLLWLSFLGAVGKTAGGWVIYAITMRAEDLVLSRFGKFLGIDRSQIEALSARLNKGWKDDVTLTVLRALPFMPSSLLSVGCGLLKVHLRTFLVSSMAGNFIRNLIFLYMGYAGKASFESVLRGLDSVESVAKIVILVGLGGVVLWAYLQRNKKKFPAE